MKPQEIFNVLMDGNKVKLTDEKFKQFIEEFNESEPTPINCFTIRSLEQYCVNLFDAEENAYYDFEFEDISEL